MKPHAKRGDAGSPPGTPPSGRERIFIEHDSVRRPFMRGILVHSLMARGLAFEDAYPAANAVRDRLRGRGSGAVEDPRQAVQDVLRGGAPPGDSVASTNRSGIRVTMPTGEAPFSKGFLSQSLLAA